MQPDIERTARRGHLAGWLLVAAVIAASVIPMITRRGIFLDGMVYATIARNLAVGIGDPLHPVYTGVIQPFRDHPPLAFWLESLVFRAFGDHFWVEKLYSLGAMLLTGGMIWTLWRWLTGADRQFRAYGWLPVLLWVLLPCWQWTAVNNLLENTLSIFVALAVYCALRAVEPGARWPAWTAAAAFGVWLAFCTKGLVGLFPLIAPVAARVSFGPRAKNVVWVQSLLVGLVAAGLFGILLHREAGEYLRAYLAQQVIASVTGQRETHPSIIGRAHILWEVVFTLFLNAAFVLAVRAAARRRAALSASPSASLRQAAWFMLIVGLAASCPVALSPKQTNFYITPSYPFYVLALGLSCVESLSALRASLTWTAVARFDRRVTFASALAILGSIAYSWPLVGAPRRDWQALKNVDRIAAATPDGTRIDVPEDLARQWALLGYLYREHYISLDPHNDDREFRLECKDTGSPPAGYRELAIELDGYRLLRRETPVEQASAKSLESATLNRR